MDADSSNQTPLNNAGGRPAWSPNGQRIVFSTTTGYQGEIHSMNASDGSDETTLISSDSHGDPDWQPLPRDTTKPTITLTTPPEDNPTYKLNAVVKAVYSCADEQGGSGLKSCTGDVANGSPIDTSTEGSKTFTVTAMDNAGNPETVTHTYNVTKSGKPTAGEGGGKGGGPKPK